MYELSYARLAEEERMERDRQRFVGQTLKEFSKAVSNHIESRCSILSSMTTVPFKETSSIGMKGRYPHLQALNDRVAVISSEGDDLELFDTVSGNLVNERSSGTRSITAMGTMNNNLIVYATKQFGMLYTYNLTVYDTNKRTIIADQEIVFPVARIVAFENFILTLDNTDNLIHVFLLQEDELVDVFRFEVEKNAKDMEVLKDGIAVCAANLQIFDLKGHLTRSIDVRQGKITALEMIDENHLAALTLYDSDQSVLLVDLKSFNILPVHIFAEEKDRMVALAKNIYATYHSERYDSGVNIWDATSGKCLHHYQNCGSICRVGSRLLIADTKNCVVKVLE